MNTLLTSPSSLHGNLSVPDHAKLETLTSPASLHVDLSVPEYDELQTFAGFCEHMII